MHGLRKKKKNYHKSPAEGIYYMFLGRYPGQAPTCEPAFHHAADAPLAPSTLPFVVSTGWPGIRGCVSGAVSRMPFTSAHPSHATASLPASLGDSSNPRHALSATFSLGGSQVLQKRHWLWILTLVNLRTVGHPSTHESYLIKGQCFWDACQDKHWLMWDRDNTVSGIKLLEFRERPVRRY